MTKDIIKLTATFLGLDDVVNYLDASEPEKDESNEKIINELIVYLNYVVREVTKEYYPLSRQDKVTSNEQCQIPYSSLEKSAVSIKDVKNSLGLSVKFELYPEYISVQSAQKEYFVSYNYTPASVSNIDDELVLPLGLDYFVISYGIASEYALSKLLYDEAELWQTKFRNSLERVKSRVGERRFQARKLK